MALVECEGRIVHREALFKLRDAVLSQTAARIVVLDLSEVDVRGGGGLGMARIPAAMGLRTRYSADAVQSLPILARQAGVCRFDSGIRDGHSRRNDRSPGPCRWPICPRFLNIKSKEQTLC